MWWKPSMLFFLLDESKHSSPWVMGCDLPLPPPHTRTHTSHAHTHTYTHIHTAGDACTHLISEKNVPTLTVVGISLYTVNKSRRTESSNWIKTEHNTTRRQTPRDDKQPTCRKKLKCSQNWTLTDPQTNSQMYVCRRKLTGELIFMN